jgi:hypothetical protein
MVPAILFLLLLAPISSATLDDRITQGQLDDSETRKTLWKALAPLYSTSWENTASQSLAKKLRLSLYGVDFHVT